MAQSLTLLITGIPVAVSVLTKYVFEQAGGARR
jgi:hypothetical protein